jgi:class II flagellar assembly regulator FliX
MGRTPMEIKGPGRVEASSLRRLNKAGGSVSGFSVSEPSDAPRAASLSAPGPLTAVETILTLQNIDDAASGPSKGVAHGEALLELLDDVRDGLLSGGIPRATLNKLASAVTRRHETFSDPRLQTVLDEIELRARVELAKLEQADRAAA